MKRSLFLQLAAAAAAVPLANPFDRRRGALVLAGGGARGAYEAGFIEGLRRASKTSDGSPLPNIDIACGTSIGSLNAWFVATGQYSTLAALWHNVASEHVFSLKRRYAATTSPHAFVITKFLQSISLARGLTRNDQGMLDESGLQRWIDTHVDPKAKLIMPFVFTTTNLDRERPELFFRLPFSPDAVDRDSAVTHLRAAVGTNVSVRVATDSLLPRALRAANSIPMLFDPVVLPVEEGTRDRFVDGGIADLAPIDVGRAVAHAVYAIIVQPKRTSRQPYRSALEIGIGSFGVAEERIFEGSLRASALASENKRLFANEPLSPRQRRFLDNVLDVDLFLARPLRELPAGTVDFDRQDKIDATYAIGLADAARGWVPFTTERSS